MQQNATTHEKWPIMTGSARERVGDRQGSLLARPLRPLEERGPRGHGHVSGPGSQQSPQQGSTEPATPDVDRSSEPGGKSDYSPDAGHQDSYHQGTQLYRLNKIGI